MNLEKPDPNEWAHRSSRGRCLHPFDEAEMRKCKDFEPSGDVFKCKHVSRTDYTTCEKK